MLSLQEIIDKRKKMKVTQTELANVVGMVRTSLVRIESGKIDCRESTLLLLDTGLKIIAKNRHRSVTGVIVLNELDFKNILYKSIIPELELRVNRGAYVGDIKDLSETLVELIMDKVTNDENNR